MVETGNSIVNQDTQDLTVYARMLANKHNDLTRRAYQQDLSTFAQFLEIDSLATSPHYPIPNECAIISLEKQSPTEA